MTAPRLMRQAVTSIGLIVLAGVVSIFLTLLLHPFWRWVERTTGVESTGHSGPAEWCYGAVFAACLLGIGAVMASGRTRRSSPSHRRPASGAHPWT